MLKSKQKGKIQLKKRVNITHGSTAIFVHKKVRLSIEQFKIIKSDLLAREGHPIFLVSPNKPVTSKGILVRMGKGKGKIVSYCRTIPQGTVCILLSNNVKDLASFLKKYPFFGVKHCG